MSPDSFVTHLPGRTTLPTIFNLEDLRLSQDFAGLVGVKKALVTVPVRKPTRQDFVRVHSDPTWRFETALLQFKDDRETFVVAPGIQHELAGELVAMVLFTAITRQGVCFLWPSDCRGRMGDTTNGTARRSSPHSSQ